MESRTPELRNEKEGRRAAALRRTVENMTKAEKVQRRFSAGRPTNELRTAQEAIWMARALKHQLHDAMKEEGLSPDDCYVHIAALTPDLSMLLTHRFVDGNEEEIKALHGKVTSVCSIMVGLIFAIEEREPKAIKQFGGPHKVLGAKAFLNTKLVADALSQRILTEENMPA